MPAHEFALWEIEVVQIANLTQEATTVTILLPDVLWKTPYKI